jgi:nucleotide-binding universal stress UspA family protein
MPTASRHQLFTPYPPLHALARSVMDGGVLQRRTIVLAVKGGPECAAATCMAAALAESRGAQPMVIRAYFPAPALAMTPRPATVWAASAVHATRHGVRHELLSASPTAGEWPILVIAGAPSEVIAATAREVDAALIVTGLHARSGVRPTVPAETALRLMRITGIPVLAVTPSLRSLPKRTVVEVDFGKGGLRAARAALTLLADGGALDLAFVDTRPCPTVAESEGDEVIHRQDVGLAVERLRAGLAAPAHVTVSTIVLEGAPSEALRSLAERTDADLIAVCSRRHGVDDRGLLRSVTAALVHDAGRSLLIVPLDDPCL